MQDVDVLVGIAQLAVGLAGFTGVASMLQIQGSAAHSRAQAERLRGMIEMALLCAAFALLPIIVQRAAASEPIAWRVSAGCFLVAAVPSHLLGIRRAIRVNREAGVSMKAIAILGGGTLGLFSILALALITCLVGVAPGSSGYLLALYAQLIFSGALFFRFFLWGHASEPE